ncbi:uncharacterized protein LOC113331576 [Papaver somniferum]|uniref:uncharacterized protein LOC113331576 n=1 Tax=Papaver somniferum TaxID=3469 RepID=UPI000E703F8C|nr:uncharacterized protein LOC113331576 [Papaver somniferum]
MLKVYDRIILSKSVYDRPLNLSEDDYHELAWFQREKEDDMVPVSDSGGNNSDEEDVVSVSGGVEETEDEADEVFTGAAAPVVFLYPAPQVVSVTDVGAAEYEDEETTTRMRGRR